MKVIKTITALVFLLLIFSIVSILYLVKFNNKSLIGKNIKQEFIKYPALVSLAGLNEPGDYRYDYVDPQSSKIRIKLAQAENVEVNDEVSIWLEQIIKETLNKEVAISKHPTSLSILEFYSDQDLNEIRSDINESYDEPVIYVVYLSKYQDRPGLAGITLHKDTIFIFKNALEELNENPELVARLEQSTIMHEWAHLLGVEHTEDENCIMSEKIDVYENPDSWKGFIPIEYCSSTLSNIKLLR